MNDDDPELEEVRSWYVDGRRVHNPFASDAALVRRFDVWLSGVIREAKADALDEFADTLGVNAGDEDSDEWRGYRNGQRQALRMATERAAAIRAGGSDE